MKTIQMSQKTVYQTYQIYPMKKKIVKIVQISREKSQKNKVLDVSKVCIDVLKSIQNKKMQYKNKKAVLRRVEKYKPTYP